MLRNLYALPTPLVDGASESKIEDFFDATTKATIIGGKTFNDSNSFDVARHYGKNVFAYQVVEKKAASISFEGFRPLLTNLVEVIKSHSAAARSAAPAQ